jgi:hypothetical protein
MTNLGYETARDGQYMQYLEAALGRFGQAHFTNLAANRTTVFLFPGGLGSQLLRARRKHNHPPYHYYTSWISCSILAQESFNLQIQPNGVDYDERYVIADGEMNFDHGDLHPYRNFRDWCSVNGIDLFVFGFDWRRGAQDAASFFLDVFLPRFDEYFAGAGTHPLDNFFLVGHSLGGMVIKLILNARDNPYVQRMKKAITVGTPFYGYGGQIHRYFKGDPDLVSIHAGGTPDSDLMNIVGSMPGGYEYLYLDNDTYEANKVAFANDHEGYHLHAYPSVDKNNPAQVADPYHPTDTGSKFRWPRGFGFDVALLNDGLTTSRRVSQPLDAAIAPRFFNIRGVQTRNGAELNNTAVGQTWKRVTQFYNPRNDGDPVKDIMGRGDGVQPAWTTRLLGLPDPAAQITTIRNDLEHMDLMSVPAVQARIAELLGLNLDTIAYMMVQSAPPSSREDLNRFLEGLRKDVFEMEAKPADRRRRLARYLSRFKRDHLRSFLARAWLDALKPPGQKGMPVAKPTPGTAAP